MILAHSFEFLLPFWLLWIPGEFFAIGMSVGAFLTILKDGSATRKALNLSVFPLVFGVLSLEWFHRTWLFEDVWWLHVSALSPAMLGLMTILSAMGRMWSDRTKARRHQENLLLNGRSTSPREESCKQQPEHRAP